MLGRGLQGLGAFSAPLATAAKWLIILGIAYTVATTVLFFVSGSDEAQAGTTATEADRGTPQPPVNLQAIVNRHLFGVADAPAEEAVDDSPAVETRLPLELQAVFVATAEEEDDASTAIIAQRGKGGLLYRISDVVPGNAKLVEVLQDHVILSRAGARERLNFPRTKAAFAVTPNQPDPAPQAAATPTTAREAVESVREQLDSDPEALLDQLDVETQEGGGYKIGSLANTPFLSQAGLQPGDVILSVNGQPVGDVDADRAHLTQVLEQGTARIEIQRGSRRIVVTTSLK